MANESILEPLTDAEYQWIEYQLSAGVEFVSNYAPEYEEVSLEALDAGWEAWLSTEVSDVNEINQAINCVGITFGSVLVATGEFEWCIATDEEGTDLVIRALPDQGDVLVYPANFVAKRWESKVTNFLVSSYYNTMQVVEEMRAEYEAYQSPS